MIQYPTAYEGDRPYIFISYAHKDTEQVLPAIEALQNAGFPVWYDAGIQAGTEWPEYIANHLFNSALVIAFISQASLASNNCRQEINFAVDNKKPMLTVRMDETPLSPGLQMRLSLSQALFSYKYPSKNEFYASLTGAPFIAATLQETEINRTMGIGSTPNASSTTIKTAPTGGTYTPPPTQPAPASASTGSTMSEASKERILAVLCYLGYLYIIPILFLKSSSENLRFHLNQGLLLILVSVARWILCAILPYGLSSVLNAILWILILVLAVRGCYSAWTGKRLQIPYIGKFQLIK